MAIGRALLMKPRLLLLDEPLASLDRARKLEILPYLARLRDEAKVPMIYVSHQAGEIQRLCSQVVRIEDGRVAAVGGLELLDAEGQGIEHADPSRTRAKRASPESDDGLHGHGVRIPELARSRASERRSGVCCADVPSESSA